MAKDTKSKAVQAAQKYISKGQYKKAIGEYEKVLKEDPEDIRLRLKLADLYLRLKDTERAVQTFIECANHYEQQGFAQKAVAVYKQVLGIVPDRVDLHLKLARTYKALKRENDAAQHFRGALESLDRSGDQKGKLDVIRDMLDMDPDNVRDRVQLAEAYVNAGQQVEAIREFRRVVEALDRMRDADPDAYTRDFQGVAERYLYHRPDDAVVAKKLAATYIAADQPERALPKLKVAFKKSPSDLECLGVIAEAFDQLGQNHKAVTVYKEMARLYGKSGLERERDDCLRNVLAVDPTDEDAREALGETTSDVTGTTIEFDSMSAAPRPPTAPLPPGAGRPGAPAGPAADDLIDDLIAQASGGPPAAPAPPAGPRLGAIPRPPGPGGPPRPPAPGGPPRPPTGRPPAPPVRPTAPPPRPAPPAPPVAQAPAPPPPAPPVTTIPAAGLPDELDFDDDDDDDDDDLGFADAGVGEKTLVDNLFIPDDVLADVQAGLDWAQPGVLEDVSAADRKVREDLRELDFYIKNGLKDEAETLLQELIQRHGEHAEIVRRRETVENM